MISTSDIKKGLCIKYSNDIYKIIEFLHVKPGKGPAFVRTKLKSVTSGKVIDNTFPAGHKIDDVRVENRKYQYLYNDGETFHFMNTDDYNQIEVNKSQFDYNHQYIIKLKLINLLLKEVNFLKKGLLLQ